MPGRGSPKSAGKMKGMMLPQLGAVLIMPNVLWDTARLRRMHEKACREALKHTLLYHWRHRWRDHFKQTNRARYDHDKRSAYTRSKKRRVYHSNTDLVKTSRTKHSMTTRMPKFSIARSRTFGGGKVRLGRGTASGGITGQLRMSFPFPTNAASTITTRRDGSKAITPSMMASELARWTTDELKIASGIFIRKYKQLVVSELAASPKWKKKYGPGSKQWG